MTGVRTLLRGSSLNSSCSAEFLPVLGIDVDLVENTAQRTDRDFALTGNYRGVDGLAEAPDKLYVTSFLMGFYEPCRLKSWAAHF